MTATELTANRQIALIIATAKSNRSAACQIANLLMTNASCYDRSDRFKLAWMIVKGKVTFSKKYLHHIEIKAAA